MRVFQKIVLIIYVFGFLFLSLVYVPYTAKAGNLHLYYYRSLWSPRHFKTIDHYDEEVLNKPPISRWDVRLNTSTWVLEIVSLSLVCGVVFFLAGRRKQKDVPQIP